MTKAAISKSFRGLPVKDRIDLLEELQLSISSDEKYIPIPAWQKKLFDQRLEQFRKNPEDTMSLAEFRAKAQSAIRTIRRAAKKKTRDAIANSFHGLAGIV